MWQRTMILMVLFRGTDDLILFCRRKDEGRSGGLKQHLDQYEGILKKCEETINRLKVTLII